MEGSLKRIRPAERGDAAAVRGVYAPFCASSSPISFELEPPTVPEMRKRIEQTQQMHPWLVGESEDGELVGYAYAGPFRERPAYRWAVETAIYVGAGHQRRGVGRALYGALLPILRRQGFVHAYACITLPHPASVALHEALGYERVGVFENVGHKGGRWHDVGFWHLALRELEGEPEPPLPWPRVKGEAGFGG